MKSSFNVPKIAVNAEFQRLLWLNFSWTMVICVIIVYFLFFNSLGKSPQAWVGLGMSGMMISVIAGWIMMERSLNQDIENNTFDQLRMSSLSPWQMVYSRILAAPVLAWVSFVVGWLIALYGLYSQKLDQIWQAYNVLAKTGYAILWVWSLYCLFLTNSLQFKRGLRQWSGSALQGLLLLIVLSLVGNKLLSSVAMIYIFSDSLWISLTTVIFTSIMVNAAMAQTLHLRPSKPTFLLLSLLIPVVLCGLLMISLDDRYNFRELLVGNHILKSGNIDVIWQVVLFHLYSLLAAFSLIVQDNRKETLVRCWREISTGHLKNALHYFPAWIILLPLAVVGLALAGYSSLGLLVLAPCMLIFSNFKIPYNSVTFAMLLYLIIYALIQMGMNAV